MNDGIGQTTTNENDGVEANSLQRESAPNANPATTSFPISTPSNETGLPDFMLNDTGAIGVADQAQLNQTNPDFLYGNGIFGVDDTTNAMFADSLWGFPALVSLEFPI